MTLYSFVSQMSDQRKRWFFFAADLATAPVAFGLTLVLLTSFGFSSSAGNLAILLIFVSALSAIISNILGLQRIQLNAFESGGILRSAFLALIVTGAAAALSTAIVTTLPTGAFLVFGMVYLIVTVSSRMILRQIVLAIYRSGSDQMRVIVYGAGQTGLQLAAALRAGNDCELVAFIDDNPKLQSLTLVGAPVFAPSRIEELIARKNVSRVVLAMPSATPSTQARIALRLRQFGCEVHALPSFAELVGDGDIAKRSSPVSIDELLGRNGLDSELPTVAHTYQGKRILVTGAGGSIGSELCRQLVACRPAHLDLLDHSELALYTIEKELQELAPDVSTTAILGSVCDDTVLHRAFAREQVDVVLHAAAYKHVPLVEKNEVMGLKNNVLGTRKVAEAAQRAGVDRFILVSSDKAVRPANIMGASKRLAELVVQDLATRSSSTMFSMVRFGNVLGSSGSVIPLFEEQIARGGPVTLTHNDVARYFMTISEAARLVLLAGSFARGGDVFVLDMGGLVPIRKLARQMIEGAGYTVKDDENPLGDIQIKVTGLRPGEKLIEELLISPDMLTTPHPKILRAQENLLSEIEVATALKDLRIAIDEDDPLLAREVVTRWVEPQEAHSREATTDAEI